MLITNPYRRLAIVRSHWKTEVQQFEQVPHNLMAEFLQEYGDVEAAFANAPHVFKESLLIHRGGSHSIECRGCVARYEDITDELTFGPRIKCRILSCGLLLR